MLPLEAPHNNLPLIRPGHVPLDIYLPPEAQKIASSLLMKEVIFRIEQHQQKWDLDANHGSITYMLLPKQIMETLSGSVFLGWSHFFDFFF